MLLSVMFIELRTRPHGRAGKNLKATFLDMLTIVMGMLIPYMRKFSMII